MGTSSSYGGKPSSKSPAAASFPKKKSVALPAKKNSRRAKSVSPQTPTAPIPKPLEAKAAPKPKKPAMETKTSAPTRVAPSETRAVAPEALERIAKASASAAKVGKGMLAFAAAKAARVTPVTPPELPMSRPVPAEPALAHPHEAPAPAAAPVLKPSIPVSVPSKPARKPIEINVRQPAAPATVSPVVTPLTPVPVVATPPAKAPDILAPPTIAPALTTALAPARTKPPTRKPLVIKSRKLTPAPTVQEATQQPVSTPVAETPAGKRIVFIASECTPLAQTGGLGDVVAGLSKALRKRGHDARIIMPLYGSIDRQKYGIIFSHTCCAHFGSGEEIWFGVHEGKLDGEVPIWFIDYERYFNRPYIYDDREDCYRFGLLSKAALQVCKDAGWIPHVAHVHDWMTSMAAVFLKTWERVLSPLSNTASVLTIHNIGYQGKFDPPVMSFYGLGPEYYTPDRFEDFGSINLLKAGIQYADAVTTVSPTYANEIRGPVGGMGLGSYLTGRGDNVFGIVNGVDTDLWNPATDDYLPARYSVDNLSGKAACKRALQERFGLAVDPKIPLFGVVSRFAPQKGFDLIRGALPQALRDMVMQFVVLGTGDTFTENFFRWLHGAFPRSANAHIGFAPEIAHLVEAGSDFFVMPSIYEPCGLNQMYSSIYGALPIVRATGGLEDTVENYNEAEGTGTGFKFWEISGRALFYSIGWAVSTWWDRPAHYAAMQRQGMRRDFTWDASAKQYENVYARAIEHRARI